MLRLESILHQKCWSKVTSGKDPPALKLDFLQQMKKSEHLSDKEEAYLEDPYLSFYIGKVGAFVGRERKL